MTYTFQFNAVWSNLDFLLSGVWMTVWITLGALAGSLALGLIIGIVKLSPSRILRGVAVTYVEIFRNTPALIQLIWIYYCLPILTGLDLSAGLSCGIALALYGAAYNAEILRAGIQSVDRGQAEAARAIGLSRYRVMRHVILPQALRRMIPPLVNEAITLLKFSSLASVLGVAELTYQAQVLATTTFRPLEIFTAIAVVYFVLCGGLALVARQLERHLSTPR